MGDGGGGEGREEDPGGRARLPGMGKQRIANSRRMSETKACRTVVKRKLKSETSHHLSSSSSE